MEMYTQSNIELSNGVKFTVWTTIPSQHGNVDSVNAALDCWLARTDKYTAKSFVDYINSKGVYKAMTNATFKAHPNKSQISQN